MESFLRLLPDDEPEKFYQKMLKMPLDMIKEDRLLFKRYITYFGVLDCYIALKNKPDLNVGLVYNEYGWHFTMCDFSNPEWIKKNDDKKNICKCQIYLLDSANLVRDLEATDQRCYNCRRQLAEPNEEMRKEPISEPTFEKGSELLRLLPDDEPEVFYKKLVHMAESMIKKDRLYFQELSKYYYVVETYVALKKKPEVEVSIVYNGKGWHLTICNQESECQCQSFMKDLQSLFRALEKQKDERCERCFWKTKGNREPTTDETKGDRELEEPTTDETTTEIYKTIDP